MTTFDYSRMVNTANRMIAKFGQIGALRKAGASTGPAWNPTPGSPDDDPAEFVITAYQDKEIDGSRVLASDKKVYVSPHVVDAPTVAHRLVEANGTSWAIINVDTVRPADTTLLYVLQLRK